MKRTARISIIAMLAMAGAVSAGLIQDGPSDPQMPFAMYGDAQTPGAGGADGWTPRRWR